MSTNGTVALSMNELVSALALCGYSEIASQILNDATLVENEEEEQRFIREVEQLLHQKGYLDVTRESLLVPGLENLIHLLVQSREKVRCVDMKKRHVLLLHRVHDSKTLVQHVKGNEHSFSFHDSQKGFFNLLGHFFASNTRRKKPEDILPMEINSKLFDELHTSEPEVLLEAIQDEKVPSTMRLFLQDFLDNGQELNNFAFMESDYVKNRSVLDQVAFFLPSKSFIWHIDYEKIEKNKIFIVPVSFQEYFQKIEETIKEFFHLS
jgi:hypothetical protein